MDLKAVLNLFLKVVTNSKAISKAVLKKIIIHFVTAFEGMIKAAKHIYLLTSYYLIVCPDWHVDIQT